MTKAEYTFEKLAITAQLMKGPIMKRILKDGADMGKVDKTYQQLNRIFKNHTGRLTADQSKVLAEGLSQNIHKYLGMARNKINV